MKYLLRVSIVLSLLIQVVSAQVPSLLNYQGRVAVSGVNFDGVGQFRFALVNSDGTQTFWSNDGTSVGGSEPTAAVSVTVASGIYSVLLGDDSIANMTAVPATVFSSPDVRIRTWFDDGVNGSELMTPDQRIAAVGYAMVSGTVSDGAITAAKIAPGAVGSSQLAAGAVSGGLATEGLSAVASGGIIGSTDPANAALLAQGYVRDPISMTAGEGWQEMPSGDAVAGHTAVWTGSEFLIWGGVVPASDPGGLSSVEGIKRGLRYDPSTGDVAPISTVGAPVGRFGHSAVWTGTEMIVWGGQSPEGFEPFNTGGRYNPATDTWSALAPSVDGGDMPIRRTGHLAFWTGTKMLVFGGSENMQQFGETNPGGIPITAGRIYDPATNAWSDAASAPTELSNGSEMVGVWTGTEVILWSGQAGDPSTEAPYAGRYNPATDSWGAALPRIPGVAQVPESGFSAQWSGTEMILWGGYSSFSGMASNAGYRFNPTTNTWATVQAAGAPSARAGHYAAWSGSEMIVWGGGEGDGPGLDQSLDDGARYDPATNTWTALPVAGTPDGRKNGTATWAGDRFIVWAGAQFSSPVGASSKFLKQGAAFDPVANEWSALANGSPAPRVGHSAVWTGTEWIIWGGTTSYDSFSFDPSFADGGRFNPATNEWSPISSVGAPSGRWNHSAVWTGTEMIIWGGKQFVEGGGPGNDTLATGARYNPATDTWTTVGLTGQPPSARDKHRSVWTGTRMLVWGGEADLSSLATGASYDPAGDSWTEITTTGAPSGRHSHICVWTGTEMLVWGRGDNSDGGRYNPSTDSWQSVADPGMNRFSGSTGSLTSAWTGSELLVFEPSGGIANFGAYSPVSDSWESLPTSGSPAAISSGQAVWTGSEFIVWGAGDMPESAGGGGRFDRSAGSWRALTNEGAPGTGFGSAVWIGTELLQWGGKSSDGSPDVATSDKGFRYQLPREIHLYRRP